MKRKIFFIPLIILILFSFSNCSNNDNKTVSKPTGLNTLVLTEMVFLMRKAYYVHGLKRDRKFYGQPGWEPVSGEQLLERGKSMCWTGMMRSVIISDALTCQMARNSGTMVTVLRAESGFTVHVVCRHWMVIIFTPVVTMVICIVSTLTRINLSGIKTYGKISEEMNYQPGQLSSAPWYTGM